MSKTNAEIDFSPLLNEGIVIHPNAQLSKVTTFQLGGVCRGLIMCQTAKQLTKAVHFLSQRRAPFCLIGGGSNLVVSDEGIDCYVIRFHSETPEIRQDGHDLVITASTRMDDVARFAAHHGLEGINFMSDIPGTIGGAIVGNAGAFGKQIGDVVHSISVIDPKGGSRRLQGRELKFSYRNSVLKESQDIILSAKLSLRPADPEFLRREREEIIRKRYKVPFDIAVTPCAGSFFRNIEPTSKAEKRQAAGYFLEQAGAKSMRHAGAKVYEHHANMIIKGNGCSAQDVYELSRKMATAVKDKFGLDLVREVRFVGRFKGMPENIHDWMW